MLNLSKKAQVRWENDNRGSVCIPLLCSCLVLSVLISTLYIMGHDVHKFIVESSVNSELQYLNEFNVSSVNKILLNQEKVDKIFLLEDKIYTIYSVEENGLSCNVQGIKKGECIVLMGEAKKKSVVNRIFVELYRQGEGYVPRYWNY